MLESEKPKRHKRYPFGYYGGKNQMLKYILPNIPSHTLYCEAFVGGGAVFWAKSPSKIEIINDKNNLISNFYEVVKTDFQALRDKVSITLHSQNAYREAKLIYNTPMVYSKLERAWAVWTLCNQSYGSIPGAGFAFQRKTKNSCANKVHNKRLLFENTDFLLDRMNTVTVESNDACFVIKRYDSEDSFFYLDPPYINSAQGHYAGYTEEHYKELLSSCEAIKGKFLLSSYPSDILDEFTKRNGWYQIKIEKAMSMVNNTRKKVEVLTANYPIKV
ncbi:MAG: methyltransferase [Flexibacter sp. CG_4_10_14_3_um_filter_32_15]|nr:MAG: methyltransferase [Flexibacter sp. CG_4_10_14_3_um_filter_32_15]